MVVLSPLILIKAFSFYPCLLCCTLYILTLFREAFYKDVKFQLFHGLTFVHDSRKAIIGARIAQAEFGDFKERNTSSMGLVYPRYFPNWSEGDALHIAKEHMKLKGNLKWRDVPLMF